MPKRREIESSEEPGRQAESYVYDFLYHDSRRVGSYLSQLGRYGLLKSTSHKQSSGEGEKSVSEVKLSGGIPGAASIGKDDQSETTSQHGAEREDVYDPLWINALNLYEKIEGAGLVIRDLSKARIGQFVLISGSLWVFDLDLMKQILSTKEIRKLLGIDPKPPSGPRQARERAESDDTKAGEMALALIPLLPHLIQARVYSEYGEIWSSLEPTGLTIKSGDLFMKHGSRVVGDWKVFGVLDALPEHGDEETPDLPPYIKPIASLAGILRPHMGRPQHAYGVTPILVFREIGP